MTYMQEDELNKGQLLISTTRGFYTLSPDNQLRTILNYRDEKYVDSIVSFVQHNSTHIILVDSISNCLLWLKHRTDISILAGRCGSRPRSVDGVFDDARFNQPGIIVRTNPDKYCLSEEFTDDGVIKYIDLKLGSSRVFFEKDSWNPYSDWSRPYAMAFYEETNTLFISSEAGIFSFSFEPLLFSNLTENGRAAQDGPFSQSKILSNKAIVVVNKDLLVVVQNNNQLRVMDLHNKVVSSLKETANRKVICALSVPAENRIYLGGDGGISVLTCK